MIHLALSHLLLILLERYCLGAIHDIIRYSPRLLCRFGALPVIDYLYEYFSVYTGRRFSHILAIDELLPTGMVLFFVLFVTAYHREIEVKAENKGAAHRNSAHLAGRQKIISLAYLNQKEIYLHKKLDTPSKIMHNYCQE